MKKDKKKEKIYKGQAAEKEDCPLKKRTDGNPGLEGGHSYQSSPFSSETFSKLTKKILSRPRRPRARRLTTASLTEVTPA